MMRRVLVRIIRMIKMWLCPTSGDMPADSSGETKVREWDVSQVLFFPASTRKVTIKMWKHFSDGKKIFNVNRLKFEMVRIYFPQFDGFSRSQESLEGNEACLWLQSRKRKNNLINFWTFFSISSDDCHWGFCRERLCYRLIFLTSSKRLW